MPKCTKKSFRKHYRYKVEDLDLLFVKEYSVSFKYAVTFCYKFWMK